MVEISQEVEKVLVAHIHRCMHTREARAFRSMDSRKPN